MIAMIAAIAEVLFSAVVAFICKPGLISNDGDRPAMKTSLRK